MARKPDRKKSRASAKRHYPRTARLNTLLQQIAADFLERREDERIGFLTVTGVEVDSDLNKAQVFISALADDSMDEQILDALRDHRKPLQAEIAREARLRKTPEVVFLFDPAVREGARIESILSGLALQPEADTEVEDSDPDAAASHPERPAAEDER